MKPKENCLSCMTRYMKGFALKTISMRDGMVMYKGRIMICSDSKLKNDLLYKFHDTLVVGHARVQRTLVRLTTIFYWPNMKFDVQNYVSQCATCQ